MLYSSTAVYISQAVVFKDLMLSYLYFVSEVVQNGFKMIVYSKFKVINLIFFKIIIVFCKDVIFIVLKFKEWKLVNSFEVVPVNFVSGIE